MLAEKQIPPSLVPLLLTRNGETTRSTWGEWLAAHRRDRVAVGSVWRVVTRTDESAVIDGVTIRRGDA